MPPSPAAGFLPLALLFFFLDGMLDYASSHCVHRRYSTSTISIYQNPNWYRKILGLQAYGENANAKVKTHIEH
jgi:hypothetical protein